MRLIGCQASPLSYFHLSTEPGLLAPSTFCSTLGASGERDSGERRKARLTFKDRTEEGCKPEEIKRGAAGGDWLSAPRQRPVQVPSRAGQSHLSMDVTDVVVVVGCVCRYGHTRAVVAQRWLVSWNVGSERSEVRGKAG